MSESIPKSQAPPVSDLPRTLTEDLARMRRVRDDAAGAREHYVQTSEALHKAWDSLIKSRAGRTLDHETRLAALNLLEDAELARQGEERQAAERSQAEAAKRASEQKYRALFETMDQGYAELEVIRGPDGRATDFRYLELNPQYERLTGIPVVKARGRTVLEMVPDLDDWWIQEYDRILRSGRPGQVENEWAGRWYEAKIYPQAGGRLSVLTEEITVRKKAEAALRESEARHRYLIGSWAQTIWETNADGVGVADSPSWRAYTGKTLEEWLGYGWLDAIHPDDRAYAERQWREAVAVRGLVNAEFRLRSPDGGWRWTNVRATPLIDASGEIEKWAGMNIDIDDRKRAETALRESEERLKAAFASVPVGIAVFGTDGKAVLSNAEFRRFLPNNTVPSRDPERGRCWQAWDSDGRLIPPQDWPSARALRGERVIPGLEMLYTDDDGRAFWTNVATAPIRDGAGQVTGCISVINDITERKKAEAALRESEAKFRTMFETMLEACCIFEMIYDDRGQPVDWKILEANAGYERESGLKDVAGKLASEVMPGTEAYWFEAFGRVVETGEAEQIENWHQPTGRWVHSSTARVGGSGSKRLVSVFYDITERKNAQVRQDFLLKLADGIRPLSDPGEIKEVASRLLGEQLKANRVFYAEVEGDNWIVANSFEQGAKALPQGAYSAETYGRWIMETYRAGERIVFHDTETDPRFAPAERKAYAAINVHAAIGVPLIKRGGLGAILAIHHAQPRNWSGAEIALVEETLERTWEAVERARAKKALRDSEARLQKAISIQTVGVLFFNLSGRLTDANDAFLRMSGYSLEELRRMKNFEDLTAPEFFDLTGRMARNLMERGETPPYEKQMVRPDGSRWWGLFAPTRLSGSGKESECVEFIVDISEQKTYESELSESEERYRSIVNQNVAGILQIDLAGNVLFANQQFCLRLDRPLKELLNSNVRDFIHPDDLVESLRLLRKMGRDGKPFEVEKRLLRSDGSAFWVHNAITPITGADGKTRLATITSLDINARRETEEAVRASEEQFRRAVEEAPIPVIMHAEDGQVLQISRTWMELTGYKQEDIPTFQAWLNRAYGAGANRVREHMRKLFRGHMRTLNVEMDVTTRQGEKRRWAFSASAPGILADGRRYIVGMAVDVTERAEELRAANKELQALSKRLVVAQEDERRKLALELHDEVGQQLTGLNMLLHRLSAGNAPKAGARLKDIQEAARVVAETLQRVRKMSINLRPAALDDIGLGMAVRSHIDTFFRQTGILVRVQGGRLPESKLSPEVRITGFRVIQEALTNVARHAKTKSATVTMRVTADNLRLSVRDAGRGFNLARQQKKASSGLSGMRERVALSGGHFSIESAPNRGTRVAATLPLNGFSDKK